MRANERPRSRLGCVPPGKYKKKEGHIFGSRKRVIDKKTNIPGPWIVFCSWCGKEKE